MGQYIFKQDAMLATFVPPRAGMPVRMVAFKKGSVIKGEFVHVDRQIESGFVETQTNYGIVHIPFGGRGGSVIEAYVPQMPPDFLFPPTNNTEPPVLPGENTLPENKQQTAVKSKVDLKTVLVIAGIVAVTVIVVKWSHLFAK